MGTARKPDNIEIILGNNEENATYPSGLYAGLYGRSKWLNQLILRMLTTARSNNKLNQRHILTAGNC